MRPVVLIGLLAGWATLSAASSAHADRVFLEDGVVIEGSAQRDGRKVVIQLESGSLRLPAESVARIEKAETPAERIAKERARLHAGEISERLRLSDRCREAALRCERELLVEVLAIDPDQPVARARLGYVREAGGWVSREQRVARAQQAEAERDAELERLRRERAELERDAARLAQKRARLELEAAERRARAEPRVSAPVVVGGVPWYLGQATPGVSSHSSPAPYGINGVRSPAEVGFDMPGVRAPASYFK